MIVAGWARTESNDVLSAICGGARREHAAACALCSQGVLADETDRSAALDGRRKHQSYHNGFWHLNQSFKKCRSKCASDADDQGEH